MEYCSPALSVNSDMTDEELDKYFAACGSLSNLPTPPPAKEHHTTTTETTTSSSSHTATGSSSQLQVYAQHLARCAPGAHCDVIRGFLERGNLSDAMVAFAACVLEILSEGLERSWRKTPRPAELDQRRTTHLKPDIIVLAALSLAHGYLSDRLRSARHWSIKESGGLFSVKEIEATKRAMLQDMDYCLYRVGDEYVESMLERMQVQNTSAKKHARQRTLSINLPGTAIWSHGVQTPEPSP